MRRLSFSCLNIGARGQEAANRATQLQPFDGRLKSAAWQIIISSKRLSYKPSHSKFVNASVDSIHSTPRATLSPSHGYLFNANGAILIPAWGQRPRSHQKSTSADSAIHLRS